jgi:hypothetical protein
LKINAVLNVKIKAYMELRARRLPTELESCITESPINIPEHRNITIAPTGAKVSNPILIRIETIIAISKR